MTKDISQRKKEHLELAQDENLKFKTSAGFENWRFIHNALPEINLDEIDTSTEFLSKKLNFPLLISSMSGGTDEAHTFNATLAEAAEATGCALGLGSIRAALEHESAKASFLVARNKAPNAVIMANLGIAQVISGEYLFKTMNFCEELAADGLIIHLNPMQEAFQPDGDTKFAGGLKAMETWVDNFTLPIIVKEVGQGLTSEVIKRLEDIGVKYVDIAGAGGSNWITIERERLGVNQEVLKETAREFENWGEPTAEVLHGLDTNLFVISSGGLKRPMDLPISLAMGAQMGGIAGAILKPAIAGDLEKTVETLQVWQATLKMTMFGVGVKRISDLVGNKGLLKQLD